MYIRKALFLVSFLFPYFLCLAQGGQDSLSLNADSLMHRITASRHDYSTLNIRAKLRWSDGETEQDFQAGIRVKKDSLIWMSLGIMGIEGIRVLATPDSFRMINKLTNEYFVRDIGSMRQWLLFPVSFKMLEEIIAGTKISIEEKALLAHKENDSELLYLEGDKLLETIWVNSQNYTPSKILLKDKLLKQDLAITFDAYSTVSEEKKDTTAQNGEGNGSQFSHKRNVVIHRDTSTVSLSMEITKIYFDGDLLFPFEISEKYKRIE